MVADPNYLVSFDASNTLLTPYNTLGDGFDASEWGACQTALGDGTYWGGISSGSQLEISNMHSSNPGDVPTLGFPMSLSMLIRRKPGGSTSNSGTFYYGFYWNNGNTISFRLSGFDSELFVYDGYSASKFMRVRTTGYASDELEVENSGLGLGDRLLLVARMADFETAELYLKNLESGHTETITSLASTPTADFSVYNSGNFDFRFGGNANFVNYEVQHWAYWDSDIGTTGRDDVVASPYDWWEASGLEVDATKATWNYAQNSTILTRSRGIDTVKQSVNYDSNVIDVDFPRFVGANGASLNITAHPASIMRDQDLQTTTGSLTFIGNSAEISFGGDITAQQGMVQYTARQASISFVRNVQATVANVVYTAETAIIDSGNNLMVAAQTGSLSVAGRQADVRYDYDLSIVAQTASLALSGPSANVSFNTDLVFIDGAGSVRVDQNYGTVRLYYAGGGYYTF